MRVAVEGRDPGGREGAGSPGQTVDLVALAEQELGQVRAVLAGDPRDQRSLRGFGHPVPISDVGSLSYRGILLGFRSCPEAEDAPGTRRRGVATCRPHEWVCAASWSAR